MTGDERVDRRTVLGTLASLGVASLAGCSSDGETDGDAVRTTTVGDETARELAARFAPTLYFDERESWFPTDPRPYAGDDSVVDGFDAFDGYHERRARTGDVAPDPTVFYHVVRYDDSPLAAVQYWFYSVFDQFTTNFHWHDWEVLHVFVEMPTGDEPDPGDAVPRLYVASSHSRRVPNNEFLDPAPDRVPRVLSELGSHSSALSLNDSLDQFQRFPTDGTFADITNSAIERIEDIAGIPVAYGLPRDEGAALPYVVPELDGAPLYDHERLPSVDRADLVDEAVTIRSYDALSSPPTDLPRRATGLRFDHEARDADPDVAYALVPTSEVEHLDSFTGPQLSFEFAVPRFAEDAIASHITTASTPWTQPRYADPAADVTDPDHRAALADRYDVVDPPKAVNTLLVRVTEAVTADDAPDGEGLTTRSSDVESVLLLESDPEAVPTFRGLGVVRDVPTGEHRLTVNGAGRAPYAERVTVGDAGGGEDSGSEDGGGAGGSSEDGGGAGGGSEDGDSESETDGSAAPEGETDGSDAGRDLVFGGVDGEIPLVARESATKLEVDADAADSDLTGLGVEDDFAGRLYDAPLDGPDAVYVHRGGAYTVEVRDADDAVGAFRVNPETGGDADPPAAVRIDDPQTGKASLASFLAAVAEETQSAVAAVGDRDDGGASNAVRGLAQALAAVAEAARRAAERAEAGDRGNADESLDAVAARLDRVAERLAEARADLPGGLARATDRRLEQARRRSKQARSAEKL